MNECLDVVPIFIGVKLWPFRASSGGILYNSIILLTNPYKKSGIPVSYFVNGDGTVLYACTYGYVHGILIFSPYFSHSWLIFLRKWIQNTVINEAEMVIIWHFLSIYIRFGELRLINLEIPIIIWSLKSSNVELNWYSSVVLSSVAND